MDYGQGCKGLPNPGYSMIMADGGSGFGSTYNAQIFTTVSKWLGTGLKYSSTAAFGSKITVLTRGLYTATYVYVDNAGTSFGIFVNPAVSDLIASPDSGIITNLYANSYVAVTGDANSCSFTAVLNPGDVIVPCANHSSPGSGHYSIRLIVSGVEV